MAVPQSALARHDRLWPAVAVSLAIHAALGAAAVARRQPPLALEQKPIVARLVRLGEKRPKEYLPRKEAGPPEPAPQPAAPPAPVPSAPAAPIAPARTAEARPPKAPPATSRGPVSGSGASLSSVLSKVRRQVDDARWGDPSGDPAGDASEGSAGDTYLALVQRSLQTNYQLPSTLSQRELLYLKGTVVLYIEPDGTVRRSQFVQRSGNTAFDEALERTILRTRLPPPPDALRELYRSTGLQVIFHL
jgi:colicin import membrane protein/protein TonB